jgi:tetratricopeptide (TPR) repeat protein
MELGNPEAASQALEHRLQIATKTLGEDDLNMAIALANLASLRDRQGQLENAGSLYERALAIREKHYGPDDENLSRNLLLLASVRLRLHDDAAAEGYYLRALKSLANTAPSKRLGNALHELGKLYSRTDRFPEAVQYLERALTTREKVLSPNDEDVAETLEELAGAYVRSARPADAEAPLRRALSIRAHVHGADAEQTTATRAILATVLAGMGQFGKAEDEFLASLKAARKGAGAKSLPVATLEFSLGLTYFRAKDPKHSEPLLRHAIEVMEMFPADTPQMRYVALLTLMSICEESKREDEAAELRKRAKAVADTQRRRDRNPVTDAPGTL